MALRNLEPFTPKIRASRKSYRAQDGTIKKYRYWVCDYVEDGIRHRKSFQLKADAEKWAKEFARRRDEGRDFLRLSPAQIGDAVAALELLDRAGRNDLRLFDTARLALRHAPVDPEAARTPLLHAIADYLEQARRDGLRPRTLNDIEQRLDRLPISGPTSFNTSCLRIRCLPSDRRWNQT